MTNRHPLTEYRESQEPKLTLEGLGTLVGVTKASLSRIEAGLQMPSPDLARALETETGVPRWKLRPDLWEEPLSGRAA